MIEQLEKRKKKLEEEYAKGQKAMIELSDTLKRIQGAHALVQEQIKENSPKKGSKKAK